MITDGRTLGSHDGTKLGSLLCGGLEIVLGLSLGGLLGFGKFDGDLLTLSLGVSDGSLERCVVIGDGETG